MSRPIARVVEVVVHAVRPTDRGGFETIEPLTVLLEEYNARMVLDIVDAQLSEPRIAMPLTLQDQQEDDKPAPPRPRFPPNPGDVEAQNAVASIVTKHWPRNLRSPLFSTRVGIARDVVAWFQEHRPHQGGA